MLQVCLLILKPFFTSILGMTQSSADLVSRYMNCRLLMSIESPKRNNRCRTVLSPDWKCVLKNYNQRGNAGLGLADYSNCY